ncbi:hypothetical protein H2198_002333 [Neophaeococcomyces mojaviensis]|uniref:Uncharacterized protein n=1 Tax=Neophaeococcomyces mojaviensis TaxID=3383035 RepID=A0ACC3AEI8_9EURO|nr:hypothetical protein H2198_002333 [Knufia sp. JES_112]
MQGMLERNQIFIGDTGDLGQSIWLKPLGRAFTAGSESKAVDFGWQNPPTPTLDRPPDTRLRASCHCSGVQFEIVPPSDGKRYTARLDTCSSCRRSAGFEIMAWASVPLTKIQMPDGTPLNLSSGTLKEYVSSHGHRRYFCSVCGAKVFIRKDNESCVEVAVGILKAEEGARAEKWLDWIGEVGSIKEATDQDLLDIVRQSLKTWTNG